MTASPGERLDLGEMVTNIDLPCEGRLHDQLSPRDAVAEWVVWQVVCCPARKHLGLACTPCLTRWLTTDQPSTCPACGDTAPSVRARIVRFERINKPPTGNPPAGT